jgi:HlyD family secretion protein
MSDRIRDPKRAIRRLYLAGIAVVAILVGGFAAWSATSEISGAVIASGEVVVESSVKKVQHPTGGVVGAILVREGDPVEAGAVVMRLDDTAARAALGVVASARDELEARRARLIAERDGAEAISFPPSLVSRTGVASVATAIAGEERLFASRHAARDQKVAGLRERIAQLRERINGLKAGFAAKGLEIDLINDQLTGLDALYAKQLVSVVQIMALRRDRTRLEGERGQITADIAQSRAQIGEIELQILQANEDFRSEVLKDLRDADGRIGELQERIIAAEDQLKRTEIRAPQSGIVHTLAVRTVGGVVGGGETIMEIVPEADSLVVDVKVAPPDIDQVTQGASTMVRLLAGNRRVTPDLAGKVVRVAPDLTRDERTGASWFSVRVALDPGVLDAVADLRLMPGMPAEAFIATGDRTPLDYLAKPLREQIARAFRER